MFNYIPRCVRYCGEISYDNVIYKYYCIFVEGCNKKIDLDSLIIEKLLSLIDFPVVDNLHNYGFIIVHYASDGIYLLVSRWVGGNMLQHKVYMVNKKCGEWCLNDFSMNGIIACVWELEIIQFEKNSWIRSVMSDNGSKDSFQKYRRCQFQGSV